MAAPPFGAPPATPGPWWRRRTNIVSGIVIVLALAVLATVLVVHGGSSSPSSTPQRRTASSAPSTASPAQVATANLVDAADRLFVVPGSTMQGSFVDTLGDRYTFDVTVSNAGSVSGTLDGPGTPVQVMIVGGWTFLKGDTSFWLEHDAPSEQLATFAKQWVRVGPDTLGVDLAAYLSPELLAEDLAPEEFFAPDDLDTTATAATPAGTEIVDGQPTTVVDTASGLRAYVTTSTPRQIVRVTAAPGATVPSPSVSTATTRTSAYVMTPSADSRAVAADVARYEKADDTGLELNLSDMTEQQVNEFLTTFKSKVSELKASADAQVHISLAGEGDLSPCNTDMCVANITVSNKVTSSSKYLSVSEPVSVDLTIEMTLDGKLVKTCHKTLSMKPNASAKAKCTAVYEIPPSRNPTEHEVQAEYSAYAQALVSADLQQLANDVAAEIKSNQQLPPEEEPTPGASAVPGQRTPAAYPCRTPTVGSADGGPGQWVSVNRSGNYKPSAPWRRYQEQVTGNKLNTEYRVLGPDGKPVDFEGFEGAGGNQTYVEAKGWGYAGRLKGAVLEGGELKSIDSTAQAELDKRLNQLTRQLNVVSNTPGGRLRFVAAEPDTLAKVQAYAKDRLDDNLYKLIDWQQESMDWNFSGCP